MLRVAPVAWDRRIVAYDALFPPHADPDFQVGGGRAERRRS